MSQRNKYSLEKKLEILKEYQLGKISLHGIAKKYFIDQTTVQKWNYLYETYGVAGLQSLSQNKNYSIEFKQKVVLEYLQETVSYEYLARKYEIRSSTQVKRWVKSYNSHKDLKSSHSGGIHMTNGRKTTFQERVDTVAFCIENDMDYTKTMEKNHVSYQQIYSWIHKYNLKGVNGLIDRRGRKKGIADMTPEDKLKVENKLLAAQNLNLKIENDFLKKMAEVESGRY